ncbi:MAG: hypothetical protein COW18_10635 [Zetaproteobacteria bacterium CG12_big_fil_rev_8_21_14_0_65_54_13]|nr:MAG: hypothetical protein COW18_10635 [Zetaproteobacteria bacterium CG12_big_fil_rev_8_21_14_0_65_54_13]
MTDIIRRMSEIRALREELGKTFAEVDAVFDDLATRAMRLLDNVGIEAWLATGRFLGSLGRGAEPMLVFFEEAPLVAGLLGDAAIGRMKDTACTINRTPNANAIVPFLQTAAAAARKLESLQQFDRYLELVVYVMDKTTPLLHGKSAMHPSPCLEDFLKSLPTLLNNLDVGSLKKWVEFGVSAYANDPEGQSNYFALQSADAHNIMQRERHGTLFVDHERLLDLYMIALWECEVRYRTYSLLFDEIRKPRPYLDKMGIHLPDVYDDLGGVSGVDRYRALLAHIAAHRKWSIAIVADNFSPFQRVAAEMFEDLRVECLAIKQWPGLRRLWLALHPKPVQGAAPAEHCDLHHRLAMFSRAVLDPEHGYTDPVLLDFVGQFHAAVAAGSGTQEISRLAMQWYVQSRKPTDISPNLFVDDCEVAYRDDNRHMWICIDSGDGEDTPDRSSAVDAEEQAFGMPPCHYDEWDYKSGTYRPDWVSLYEALHPGGNGGKVERLLEKHAGLAKRMQRILDMLKPQERVRIRYQEEGSELDLDVAIRSLIDYKAGSSPDPRINMSHRTDGRNIAVTLLLDLSESLNEPVPGGSQSILELSQEAVSLLAWAVDHLGDPFAIAGFHSNARHDVRFLHIKMFNEKWDDTVKGRLSAMEAAYSTRMGAAMRHAGHYLKAQPADKKLLLILTDGQPADIDAKDERMLIEDAHRAVNELDRDGIFTYCITLDARADEYVDDIFGRQYTVIDKIERLPEKLPGLFIALTR